MGQNLQNGERLRPVDLARGHGLSTQAIRNYEAAGILPAAERTSHGYRTYTQRHAQALRAFLALGPGHGHQTATLIMQAINRDATEDALRLIDESHAQLLDDRRTLQAVEAALRDLNPVRQNAATRSSAPWREGSASAQPPCVNGNALAWSSRAATRRRATGSTARPTYATPNSPTSSDGAATCLSKSPR
jgi:DNA-binding transcriptional MerR regulator